MAIKIDAAHAPYIWATARIGLGLIFLWAFVDKLFGLGFSTCRDEVTGNIDVLCEKSWLQGGSPTSGFLHFATKGPFANYYQNLSGINLIDWLFMIGLLLIGLSLIFGVAMKVATISGVVLMLILYLAIIPPENNPMLDDHVIYAILLIGILSVNNEQKWGLRAWWIKQSPVNRWPILE